MQLFFFGGGTFARFPSKYDDLLLAVQHLTRNELTPVGFYSLFFLPSSHPQTLHSLSGASFMPKVSLICNI